MMPKSPDKNRRSAVLLKAGPQFGSASFAPSSLSAAVAQLSRSPSPPAQCYPPDFRPAAVLSRLQTCL